MAATLVGEAAIRIVPTIRGFKYEADRRLREVKLEPVKVKVHAETREATAQIDEWRAKQDLKPVVVPVKANSKQFERDIRQIEHRVRNSPLHQLTTFNIKILGLDALPALAYAAASAASGLDALGESALALPGIMGAVGSSVGALALGMGNLKQVFSTFQQEQKTTAQAAHQLADDNRTLQRSYRDYRDAVRDTTREIQDLNAENRRSSLNIADAQLSVQEAADRLRQGNFGTVTELRRAQLSYAESIDHLNDVMTKANRTQEDTNRANALGVQGSDRVVSALDAIQKATEKLDNDKVGNFGRALAKLAPNAAAAVNAIIALRGQYTELQRDVQNNLFAGMDKDITNLATRLLPTLHTGLARVATGLNADFHGAFQSLGSDRNKGFLSQIFANDDVMLQKLAKGVDPLMTSILRLTSVSADFLPRLGNAADKVFTRFDNWTEKISNDGSLKTWIDQGVHAMDDLGNIGLGIIGVIHRIGQAFDDVSGHQGGFLKTFADEMQRIDRELSSPEGMMKLEGYLRGARNEFQQIRSAWDTMKPTVKELIGYAREWSAQSLGLLGTILKLVGGFNDLTHAVGPLLEFFLAVRTAKMAGGVFGDLFAMAGAPQRGLNQLTEWWQGLGKASEAAGMSAKQAREHALRFGDAVDHAGNRYNAFGEVIGQVTPAVDESGNKVEQVGNKAMAAGEKIGGSGSSMMTKVKGLTSALGAGLSSIGLTLAITVAITALGELGKAHDDAARQAQAQADALANLKNAVDSVSGAVTKQGLTQTLQQAMAYPIQGFGNQNVIQAFMQSGLGTQGQFAQAIMPTNQGLNNQLVDKSDNMVAAQLQSSGFWGKYGEGLEKAGLGPVTMAKALRGDPDAKSKFDTFRNHQWNVPGENPKWLPFNGAFDTAESWFNEKALGALPDLQQIRQGLPNGAQASIAGQGLAQFRGSLVDAGQLAQQTNAMVNNHGRFKDPGIAAYWGQFGGLNDESHIAIGPDGNAVITTNADPHVPSNIGSTVPGAAGQFITTLTTDATNSYIQKYASGGLVRGPGGPTDDKILARLSDTEHITQAKAVNYYGAGTFDALNNMQIPQAVVAGWLSGAPHHYGGGFGGFKMDGPKPPIPIPGGGKPGVNGQASDPFKLPAAPPPRPAPKGPPAPPKPTLPPPPITSPPIGAPGGPGGLNGGLHTAGDIANPALTGGPLDPSGLPGWHVDPSLQTPGGAPPSQVGTPAAPTPGLAPVQTPYGPMTVPGGGLTADSVTQWAQSVAGRVPYVWGGFGPGGMDCSGLAGALANLATGQDPFAGGRQMSTGNEGPWLAGKGFVQGPGGPGELTIGWNADHTGITLPDGEHIDAEDEKNGIVLGPRSQGATGFPNVMHLPGGVAGGFPGMAGLMPGGVPGQLMDPSSTPMSNMGFRLQQLFNPQNMMNNIIGHYAQAYSPQNIMKFLGSQAQLAGQDMLGIFTQLVGGLTGINLQPLIGYGDQAANYGLSMIQAPNGGTPGMTDLNSAAGMGLSQFMGAGGTQIGAYSMPGGSGGMPAGIGNDPKKMAVYQAMKQAGFPDSEWSSLDALISGESSWDPTNENSSSGAFGLFQFNPTSGTLQQYLPDKNPDPMTQAVAGMAYIKARYGTPTAAYQFWQSQSPHWYASGGFPLDGLAWISNGEYRSNAAATGFYGSAAYNALNGMQIPRSQVQAFMSNGFKGISKFADGGFQTAAPAPWPVVPPNPAPSRSGVTDIPNVNQLTGPNADAGQQATQWIGAAASAIGGAASASAGGGGGGGSASNGPTAPSRRMGPPPQTPPAAPPAPGAPGGLGGPGGVVKSNGATKADNRGGIGMIGPAPKTLDHLNPAISKTVQSAAGTIGSWAAMAAQAAITAGAAGASFGAGAPAGAAAGAFASQGIQAGAQMAGEAINDGLNVLAGFAVKNQGPANGTPLLPQRHSTSMAPPVAQKIHNGDINVTNLEEYKRAQETMDAQNAMPFIGKYW